jgi:LmbE family N-acetylglucosaminyl deacetylase
MHLFVSPHLDDVALSCGGLVNQLSQQGERVVVATICTANTPRDRDLSDAAERVHQEWQLGDDNPYRFRREEDFEACARLGAETVHLDLLDAVYRHAPDGSPLYTHDFIGGQVREFDWRTQYFNIIARLRQHVRGATRVFCPLALGGHVDHALARRAVESLGVRVTYYEDYPYAQRIEKGEMIGDKKVFQNLKSEMVTLNPQDIQTRIHAIACYRSQMFALFGDERAMPQHVREYVALGGGERYWMMTEA